MVRKTGKLSQRDIARMAGVSQAAVSMVVSGKADANGIGPDTQAKIRAVLDDLGYVADVVGRSLRGGRNGFVGVHTFEPVFPVRADDYYHEFLVGIEEKAVELGQDLVLFASTQQADGTRSIYGGGSNRLRLADGAIILGLEQNDAELVRLAAEEFPFVFIGRRDVDGAEIAYVTADYTAAMGEVVDQLVAYGHRRVAYLGIEVRRGPHEERLTAFRRFAADAELEAPVTALEAPEVVGPGWLTELVESGVTALVAESNELADAAATAAAAAGLEIPAQLSAISLDRPSAGAPSAGWSHLAVPRREMGERAVAILIGLLDGDLEPGYHEIVPCGGLTGSTIAAPGR